MSDMALSGTGSGTVLGTGPGLVPALAWPSKQPVYALAPPGVVRASWLDPGTTCTLGTPRTHHAVITVTGRPHTDRRVAAGLTPGCTSGHTVPARALPH